MKRLRWLWQHDKGIVAQANAAPLDALLEAGQLSELDLFDRLQLEAVITICRSARSLSEAGRQLFHRSRTQRSVVNDADRLRKYLQKYGLNWERIAGPAG